MFLLLILLGIGIGFIASLFGIGGGFLLVPTMITIVGLDAHKTVGTVAFVIMGMGFSSTIAYARQKRIDFKITAILTLGSIMGSIIGAWTTQSVTDKFLLVGFGVTEGILAIILGLKKSPQEKMEKAKKLAEEREDETYTENSEKNDDKSAITPKRKKWYLIERDHTDALGIRYRYRSNILISFPFAFLGGFLSALLGIGGGTLYIQIYVFLCGMSIHMAIASSIFTISVSEIFATATFAKMGQIDWIVGAAYLIGMMFGAQMGAAVSKRIHSKYLKPMAALMIVIIAVRMIIFALIEYQ